MKLIKRVLSFLGIGVLVLVLAGLGLFGYINWPAGSAAAAPMSDKAKLVFDDEFNSLDTSIWQFFLNGNGQIGPPPRFHAAGLEVQNGQLVLSNYPDPDFNTESSQWVPGSAAATRYSNAFGLAGVFTPNPNEKLVVEWRSAVSPGYKGSNQLWLQAYPTFDPGGKMLSTFGFAGGAFGLSYTSPESIEAVKGLKFEYVIGLLPICLVNVPPIDVTTFNTYRIEWQGNTFIGYVNGVKMGSCRTPVTFQSGQLQVWSDVYKVLEGFGLDYNNINQAQSTRFDWVRAWTEPVK